MPDEPYEPCGRHFKKLLKITVPAVVRISLRLAGVLEGQAGLQIFIVIGSMHFAVTRFGP